MAKSYQVGDPVYYEGQAATVTRARHGQPLSVRIHGTSEIVEVVSRALISDRNIMPPSWPFEDDGDPD